MHSSPPEYLRNIVKLNTGSPQPDQLSERRLKLIAVAHGKLSLDEFERALQTAVEEGLLIDVGDGYRLPR